jgi:hypothetical protein
VPLMVILTVLRFADSEAGIPTIKSKLRTDAKNRFIVFCLPFGSFHETCWVTMPRGMDDDLSHDINSKSPELNATRRGVEELNRR